MLDPFERLLILFCLWGLMRFLFDRERDLIMTERALRGTDTHRRGYRGTYASSVSAPIKLGPFEAPTHAISNQIKI